MWPGKSFDTHGPIGAWVVTADEVDPADLGIRTWVDGELRQDGATKEIVTGIAALSRVCSWSPAASSPPGRVLPTVPYRHVSAYRVADRGGKRRVGIDAADPLPDDRHEFLPRSRASASRTAR
jgi:hypothetical protein